MAAESFAKGNEAFVEENYELAEQCYTLAIDTDTSRDEFYAARAHARIKLEKYQDAVADACKSLSVNNKNVKALTRKGIALYHLEDLDTALLTLKEAQSIDGSDKNVETWLKKCEVAVDLLKKKSPNATDDDKQKEDNPATASQTVLMPTGPQTRYDWYQTETHVIVTIMVKHVKQEHLHTDIEEKSLGVCIKLSPGSDYSLHLDLSHSICPSQCIVKVLSTKVEIKLKKAEGFRWTKLEGESNLSVKQFQPDTTPSASASDHEALKYPSSSQHTKDWDKLVADLKHEEKDEKLEGDAALNQLFQQIYSDGSDEVRKAMNKSFVESGGTVLSTNWNEIAEKKTDIKPPDGMEFKQYST